MIRRFATAFHQRQKFDQLAVDRWRADAGLLRDADRVSLKRRERLFAGWRITKGVVRLPATLCRMVGNFVWLMADIDRLHGLPRRKIRAGKGCVIDRETWLVNGSSIELGDFVKVSAFSALIAGNLGKIQIGNYTILGPGVFIVAANHGISKTGVPIRYQPWNEKTVVIGDDVWIGANAVVLPGTSIGSGAVIGAGTVVSGQIPAGAIVHQDKGSLVVRQRR